jgi:hypothetical protein
VLANSVSIADFERGLLSAELAVLGVRPDDREWEEPVVAADDRVRLNRDMVLQHCSLANDDIRPHNAIWADDNVVGKVCGRIND